MYIYWGQLGFYFTLEKFRDDFCGAWAEGIRLRFKSENIR